MVPKHLRKVDESHGGDQESLMASLIELQERIKNDKSVLRQPIDTGVRGVRDLMKAVVGGTQELQELLLNECTIIYECKICRNLFRSLANFISHKRIYCIKNFTYFSEATTKQEKEVFEQDSVINSEMVKCNKEINLSETNVWLAGDSVVPNNIKTERNNCTKPTRRIRISPLKITRKCDIAKIADGLNKKMRKECFRASSEESPNFVSDIAERVMMRRSQQQKIPPQQIVNSKMCPSEFFQNYRELVSFDSSDLSPSSEAIETIRPSNEAVLQENGKFRVTPQGMQLENSDALEKYKCTKCETHFITKQTLSRHVQIHHKERICYPCPICRTFFPSPSSTYRHLSKDHHKTEHQIRRLRPKVLTKAIKRKLVDGSPKAETGADEKSQRLNLNPEGELTCATCGKLFNRQAVLRVHVTTCKEKEASSAGKQTNPASTSSAPRLHLPETGKTVSLYVNNDVTFKPPVPIPIPLPHHPQQQQRTAKKSGIIIRRDYCKKFEFRAVSLTTSVVKNASGENHTCKERSLKRVNKWRTVLQKLQSRNGLDVNEKSSVGA